MQKPLLHFFLLKSRRAVIFSMITTNTKNHSCAIDDVCMPKVENVERGMIKHQEQAWSMPLAIVSQPYPPGLAGRNPVSSAAADAHSVWMGAGSRACELHIVHCRTARPSPSPSTGLGPLLPAFSRPPTPLPQGLLLRVLFFLLNTLNL